MAFYTLVAGTALEIPPQRLSFAQLLLAFSHVARLPASYGAGQRLCERLQRAIIDRYRRANKTSRHYPRKKKERPPGPPKIIQANPWQIERAKTIKPIPPKGL